MKLPALILVDIQNDFLPGGALAVPEGDKIIPIVNRMMDDFSVVIATQDWHPRDHGSFAANHPGRNVYDVVHLNSLEQTLWPVHCVEETHGAAFAAALETERLTKVFRKGTNPGIDSYSGFFDNGHRHSTGMGEWLREQKIQNVTICGLATDYCVKFTALDAVAEGFDVKLHLPACRGVNLHPDDVRNAVSEMENAGVVIVR